MAEFASLRTATVVGFLAVVAMLIVCWAWLRELMAGSAREAAVKPPIDGAKLPVPKVQNLAPAAPTAPQAVPKKAPGGREQGTASAPHPVELGAFIEVSEPSNEVEADKTAVLAQVVPPNHGLRAEQVHLGAQLATPRSRSQSFPGMARVKLSNPEPNFAVEVALVQTLRHKLAEAKADAAEAHLKAQHAAKQVFNQFAIAAATRQQVARLTELLAQAREHQGDLEEAIAVEGQGRAEAEAMVKRLRRQLLRAGDEQKASAEESVGRLEEAEGLLRHQVDQALRLRQKLRIAVGGQEPGLEPDGAPLVTMDSGRPFARPKPPGRLGNKPPVLANKSTHVGN